MEVFQLIIQNAKRVTASCAIPLSQIVELMLRQGKAVP
jgi:hypothetical protein